MQVVEWSRKSERLRRRWPDEPNAMLPLFLLRSELEPFYLKPHNYGVVSGSELVARFTYRLHSGEPRAFVGLVLNPAFRGRRLGRPVLSACLARLCVQYGAVGAYASIAAANLACLKVFRDCGFSYAGQDWRRLPPGADWGLLADLPRGSARLAPAPALRYYSVACTVGAV